MTTIDPSTHWIHKREGYSVTIEDLQYSLHVKDANDANWQSGVAYTIDTASNDDSPLYIRNTADFLAKFTQDERLGDEA